MILYFSGSGNSLAIARQLAEKLDERVMSLYDAVHADLQGETRIGFVYPTYWLDAPMAVKQLVAQLVLPKNVSVVAFAQRFVRKQTLVLLTKKPLCPTVAHSVWPACIFVSSKPLKLPESQQ